MRRETTEINAGSMADIAFLLLIFFLVTTTMDVDAGVSRKLPPKIIDLENQIPIKQKNIFEININRNNELLVEGELISLMDLKEKTISFIDNGGSTDLEGNSCTYCNGSKDPTSSDHPSKAVLSIQTDRGTKYGVYIAVQNELGAAYTSLRNQYALKQFEKDYETLLSEFSNDKSNQIIKDKIINIRKAYPQLISETTPIK